VYFFILLLQTHHLACPSGGEEFKGVDCHVFHDSHPMTMALSVLVTIEMLNAMNRYSMCCYCKFKKLILHVMYCDINAFSIYMYDMNNYWFCPSACH